MGVGCNTVCSCRDAAEQKARTTYDNLLRLIDNPDVREPLKFLRAREVVHFQRFGDALRVVQDNLDAKNYYAYNPAIDIRPGGMAQTSRHLVQDNVKSADSGNIAGAEKN